MKKFFALLSVGVLLLAGVRAPEASIHTNGFCSSGPVLEKAQDHGSDAHELRSSTSNPMTIHSGFAPSFHPFDLPESAFVLKAGHSEFFVPFQASFFRNGSLLPDHRPPIHLFA